LEACALVRTLTEGLLNQMLNMAEAHELFEWLRELSFIDSGRIRHATPLHSMTFIAMLVRHNVDELPPSSSVE